jgi:hypothetical protein
MIWTFQSVNPALSFVRIDSEERVLEASEKQPISDVANAGVYLFRDTGRFIDAAFSTIRKDWHVDGIYYVAPVLNEIILSGGVVTARKLTSNPPLFFSGKESPMGARVSGATKS